MAEKNLKDLLLHTLKDVYFAEHEILKALPEMAKAAGSDKLRQAFETHRSQTEQQVQRLNDVFGLLGEKPEGVPCEAIQASSPRAARSCRSSRAAPPSTPA